jgi:hypothetical protein
MSQAYLRRSLARQGPPSVSVNASASPWRAGAAREPLTGGRAGPRWDKVGRLAPDLKGFRPESSRARTRAVDTYLLSKY